MLNVIHCSTIQGKPGWRKLDIGYVFEDVVVPIGYEWNGASTPWFARSVIPKFHLTLEASCVHDYLCEHAKTKEDRKKADKLFRKMLSLKKGTNAVQRWLGYAGVRVGAFFNINGSKASWK